MHPCSVEACISPFDGKGQTVLYTTDREQGQLHSKRCCLDAWECD